MRTVFLGGTCNGSKWRKKLMDQLSDDVDAFDPVVADWNEEAQKKEVEARKNSDFVLYVITPKMTGVYSIAEVVDDSNKRPEKTLFCVLFEDEDEEFDKHQKKSLLQVGKMVVENGVKMFIGLEEIADFLNKKEK